MRCLLALTIFAAACTGVPHNGPHYDTVRERLSDAPAWLFIRDEASSGAVTARRRGHDGWVGNRLALAIERGYARIAIEDSGQLEIDQLEIVIAPITLEGVFGRPAHLHDVRLRLAKPVRSELAWTSEDEATATLVMPLDFGWAVAFDGGEAMSLATLHLPPESVDITLAGDGDHVSGRLEVRAAGELGNWADLVQISEMALSITAETAN